MHALRFFRWVRQIQFHDLGTHNLSIKNFRFAVSVLTALSPTFNLIRRVSVYKVMAEKKILAVCISGGLQRGGWVTHEGGDVFALEISHQTNFQDFKKEAATNLACDVDSIRMQYYPPYNQKGPSNISSGIDFKKMVNLYAKSGMVNIYVIIDKPIGEARENSQSNLKKRKNYMEKNQNCLKDLDFSSGMITNDITNGKEKVKISLVTERGTEKKPAFIYMSENIVFKNANLRTSLTQISDQDCCLRCKGDCLKSRARCACVRETDGEFAYTQKGLLKEDFLETCISMKYEDDHPMVYCPKDCPLERVKNERFPEKCKGHLVRKFINECWQKCACNATRCGNRVVQRGITCKLQVFLTQEGKGWGLRTLEDLPKGTFVCEYVGEILTNNELHRRNLQSHGSLKHKYPVALDADWGTECLLKDDEALCLDATFCGNVARFINHRCQDANLIDIPVTVETPDRRYYHVALFTTTDVRANTELTWDYGIDFDDRSHPIEAFKCNCGSKFCRDESKKVKPAKKKVRRENGSSRKSRSNKLANMEKKYTSSMARAAALLSSSGEKE